MSRSKWKGPYIDPTIFKQMNAEQKLIISRNSEIVPTFLGRTFHIYNGKSNVELTVTEEMLGHRFGEFSYTRSKFVFKKKKKK